MLDLKVKVFVDFLDIFLMFLAHLQVSTQLLINLSDFIVLSDDKVNF